MHDIQEDELVQFTSKVIWTVLSAQGDFVPKYLIKAKLHLPSEIFNKALEALQKFLLEHTPLQIQEVEGEIRLVIQNKYNEHIWPFRDKKENYPSLSQAERDVLSIIAYLQPIRTAEIQRRRDGTDCESPLNSLLRKKLIHREVIPGEAGLPYLYVTTKEFLKTFGLKDLAALPSLNF